MAIERKAIRGGATSQATLAEEHHAEVKARAVEFLTGSREVSGEPLSDHDVRAMMEAFSGEPLTDREFAYRRNFLSLEDHPYEARWSNGKPEVPPDFRVAIVGAGFSGIAAGVQFERLGIPYTIYERRAEIGGTWSINTYPDARVDTSSFTYQFSFEKRYPWTEFYARQPEVRAYLGHVAKRLGVLDRIQFETELRRAEFDESRSRWQLTLERADSGVRQVVTASILVSGAGLFGLPKSVNIPGAVSYLSNIVSIVPSSASCWLAAFSMWSRFSSPCGTPMHCGTSRSL